MSVDKFLFTLLLVLLPTQLAKHFFPDFSLVLGTRVDYLSPTLYFSEILLILMLIFWLGSGGKRLVDKYKKYLLLILLSLTLSILVSENRVLGLLKVIKIVELFFLFIYIHFEKISSKKVLAYLIIGGVYSSLLSFLQFIKQGSLGGLFWLIGERNFSIYTPNIAKASIFGKLYVRPYATFPHPNVLAGYLSLFIPALINFTLKIKKNFIIYLSLVIFLSCIFLTMSRIAIFVSFLGLIAALIIYKKTIGLKTAAIALLPFIVFGYLIMGRFYNLFIGIDDSYLQRQELTKTSFEMIKINPLFGTGLNNFIPVFAKLSAYSRAHAFFQPVHNTYLLILVETGIVGFAGFSYFLFKAYKKLINKPLYLIMFGQIIILLFFDHYFYTLWQTQLLFVILFGLMLKKDSYENA